MVRWSSAFLAVLFLIVGCGGGEDLTPLRIANSDKAGSDSTDKNPPLGANFKTMALGVPVQNCSIGNGFTLNFNNTLFNTGLFTCALDLNTSTACSLSSAIRSWIGHSQSASVIEGFTREQAFAFTNLVPGQTYSLKIYIVGYRGTFKSRAYISDGEITSGVTHDFNSFPTAWGCAPLGEFWEVQFTSKTNAAVLKLTNDQISGIYYFYPSHFVISKVQ